VNMHVENVKGSAPGALRRQFIAVVLVSAKDWCRQFLVSAAPGVPQRSRMRGEEESCTSGRAALRAGSCRAGIQSRLRREVVGWWQPETGWDSAVQL
jgi:hypothetical protein